jgi:hypothetical protein
MNNDGDKGDYSPVTQRQPYGPTGFSRIALVRSTLQTAIAAVALVAIAASIPHWGSDSFPVLSLVIYVAGMVFVAMPLCLCYEALLESQAARTAGANPT